MYKKALLYLILGHITSWTSELPEPYKSLVVLPANIQSLYSNAHYMEKLFAQHRNIRTVIEIGSWLGASTIHMASLLPKDGKLYAVDHWLGSEEHQKGKELWIPAMDYLYQQFLSNVIHKELAHKIIPIRMKSLEAAKSLNVRPDLIYIDAAHDTASVYADLRAWFPFVKGHGILCGDDWGWPTVAAAVKLFAKEQNLKIEASVSFWVLYE